MNGKKILVIALIVLLLGAAGVVTWQKSQHKKAPNTPPIAALRLDSIDETNRAVTLSDGGSSDPDGTLQSWRIAWGDGKEENLASIPQKAAHTYAAEGAYQISLWCVDNLGATSSPPALTNITFDFEKRRVLAEFEAKQAAEAKRLKEEQARKEAEAQKAAAEEARKAKERQEQEAKRKAEAELARQKAKEAESIIPPPLDPLAKEFPDKSSARQVIYTPRGYELGEFQILKEKVEGTATNGNVLVILAIRCVNFPLTPIVTSNWRIDGKDFQIPGGRIRASLPPGPHDITVVPRGKEGLVPGELKADVTVQPNGDCIVRQRK